MEKNLNEIAGELDNASDMHKKQAGKIRKLLSRKDNQAMAKMIGKVKNENFKQSVSIAKFIEPTPSPTMPDKKENPTLVNKPININTGTGQGLTEAQAERFQKGIDDHLGKKKAVQEEDGQKSNTTGEGEDSTTKIGTDKDGNPITPKDVADGGAKGNVGATTEIVASIAKRTGEIKKSGTTVTRMFGKKRRARKAEEQRQQVEAALSNNLQGVSVSGEDIPETRSVYSDPVSSEGQRQDLIYEDENPRLTDLDENAIEFGRDGEGYEKWDEDLKIDDDGYEYMDRTINPDFRAEADKMLADKKAQALEKLGRDKPMYEGTRGPRQY